MVWKIERGKPTRKGSRNYTYLMACWREGGRTRDVHRGSARKIDGEVARRKARRGRRRRLGYWACNQKNSMAILTSLWANIMCRMSVFAHTKYSTLHYPGT
jgi:hypothetical protein